MDAEEARAGKVRAFGAPLNELLKRLNERRVAIPLAERNHPLPAVSQARNASPVRKRVPATPQQILTQLVNLDLVLVSPALTEQERTARNLIFIKFLSGLSEAQLRYACERHCRENKFFPAPSEILALAKD